jgi:hypothetical protein
MPDRICPAFLFLGGHRFILIEPPLRRTLVLMFVIEQFIPASLPKNSNVLQV